MENQIANLPPTAMIAFGAVLAVIFGVRYLGLWQGGRAAPSTSQASAQVAAVVVDSTALNKATAAIEAHTEALLKNVDILREVSRDLDHLGTEADRIREELRIQRELRRQ